jgi:hypothetical protein
MRRGMGLVVGLVVVVFVLLLVGGSYVSSKNQMVGKDQDVKASWSDIDTTLQRRADLIPNLVETVKGYAKHEETVFADIANARAGLLNAGGEDSGERPAGQRAGAVAGDLRGVSGPEGEPELPVAAGPTGRDGEPDPGGAPPVQREAARLQHVHPAVPEQPVGGDRGISPEQCVLPGFGGLTDRAGGEVLRHLVFAMQASALVAPSVGFASFGRSRMVGLQLK